MSRKALSLGSVFALFLVAQVGFGQGVGTGLEPDPESANTRVGTRGATFLKIGVGGRAMGLAGAGATLHPGIYAMYWNPAAMASLEGFGTGFSYMALYDDLDVDHYFGAAAIPFLGGVVGVNFTALTSGDIPRTTESYPDGGDPELGSIFDWTSSLVGLYYARRITDRLNIGGGLKFIQEGISGARANYVGFDAGVTFRTGLYGVVLGATIQNVGTEGRFKGAELDRIIQSSDQLFAPNNRDLEARFGTEELQLPTLFRFTVRFDLLGVPEALFEQTGRTISARSAFCVSASSGTMRISERVPSSRRLKVALSSTEAKTFAALGTAWRLVAALRCRFWGSGSPSTMRTLGWAS
jgi:hypothetical protein